MSAMRKPVIKFNFMDSCFERRAFLIPFSCALTGLGVYSFISVFVSENGQVIFHSKGSVARGLTAYKEVSGLADPFHLEE